jgi:hypothetical protein
MQLAPICRQQKGECSAEMNRATVFPTVIGAVSAAFLIAEGRAKPRAPVCRRPRGATRSLFRVTSQRGPPPRRLSRLLDLRLSRSHGAAQRLPFMSTEWDLP